MTSKPPSLLAKAQMVSIMRGCLLLMRLKSRVRLSGVDSSEAMRGAAWVAEISLIVTGD